MIVAAALKLSTDAVVSLPRPARHGDVIAALSKAGMPRAETIHAEQGFLTSNGMFVDRRVAVIMAMEAGQITEPRWPPDLYSEDLW